MMWDLQGGPADAHRAAAGLFNQSSHWPSEAFPAWAAPSNPEVALRLLSWVTGSIECEQPSIGASFRMEMGLFMMFALWVLFKSLLASDQCTLGLPKALTDISSHGP